MLSPKDLMLLDKIALETFSKVRDAYPGDEEYIRRITKKCYKEAAIFLIIRREILSNSGAETPGEITRFEDILNVK